MNRVHNPVPPRRRERDGLHACGSDIYCDRDAIRSIMRIIMIIAAHYIYSTLASCVCGGGSIMSCDSHYNLRRP
jgi:hypothetical protein